MAEFSRCMKKLEEVRKVVNGVYFINPCVERVNRN